MPRVDDELLDEDAVVAERGRGLGLRAREAFGDLACGIGDAHALAAAAGRSLDHHGIADLVGDLTACIGSSMTPRWPGTVETLAAFAAFFELDLVAHRLDGAGIGADEDDAGLGQRLREGGPFGKKAVARMHGLRAGRVAGFHDLVDHR